MKAAGDLRRRLPRHLRTSRSLSEIHSRSAAAEVDNGAILREDHAMSHKTLRPYARDQQYLLPPSLRDWLPEGHLALFVSDVVDSLNLSAIMRVYEQGDGRGMPPYHPVMMVKLLVYGYCTGR
jgi:hypothetical protein